MSETPNWLDAIFGSGSSEDPQFTRALTHGSHGSANYERLEFLGDRVLGLVIAEWICAAFPDEPEGTLSPRLNLLVSGETCAEIGRAIGIQPHLKLGKQARGDGGSDSNNILGDVVEALIGALYLAKGLDAARDFIREHWQPRLDVQSDAPRHPKSALQEWAAAHRRKAPVYEITDRSGPHHAPRFRVKVMIANAGHAEAEGRSKQEAETAAAAALLEKL